MISRSKISMGLINDGCTYAATQKDIEKKEVEKLDLKKIIQVDFPDEQYYRQQTTKYQIVLHHTVSGQGVNGDINWWLSSAARIATHMIVDWEGKIYQCYSSKYWGHHLGIKSNIIAKYGTSKSNVSLNKESIGIEIDSWGGLIRHNRNWYPAKWDGDLKKNVPNLNVAPIQNVQVYPEGFRGYYGFEKYTDEQLEAVRKLLVFWHERYGIPITYNPKIWDVSKDALNGVPGLWTHVSYRPDKSDCHPQPELISMLKSL